MKYVGICGSDIHYYTEGRIGDQVVHYPFVLGHEGSGEIASDGGPFRAVVTGAAKGIGLAIAERLAKDGARLVLADLDEPGLKQASARLVDQFDTEVAIEAGDLSDQDVAEKTVKLAANRFGRLDILVNNAGGGIIKPFAEHTPQTLKTTIDRNLWTALWCSWYAVAQMRQQVYGRIIKLGADSVAQRPVGSRRL